MPADVLELKAAGLCSTASRQASVGSSELHDACRQTMKSMPMENVLLATRTAHADCIQVGVWKLYSQNFGHATAVVCPQYIRTSQCRDFPPLLRKTKRCVDTSI
jgi:hypothetical protein